MGCINSTQRTSRPTAHLYPPSHQREPSPEAWQRAKSSSSTPPGQHSDPDVCPRAGAAPLEGSPSVQLDGTLSLQSVLDETTALMKEIAQSKETLGQRVAQVAKGVTNLKNAIENLMAEGRATTIDYAAVLAHLRESFQGLMTSTNHNLDEDTRRRLEVTTPARSSDLPFATETIDSGAEGNGHFAPVSGRGRSHRCSIHPKRPIDPWLAESKGDGEFRYNNGH